MRFNLFPLAAIVLALASTPTPAETNPAPNATLPLEEVLRLYRENDEAKHVEKSVPPISAALHRAEFSGRLLDNAVELTSRFEVAVLDDGNWVSVPLIRKDDKTHLTQLPSVQNGSFAIDNGYLHFVTDKAGRYAFQISLLQQAEAGETFRKARIDFGDATLASCRLAFDQGLFRLVNEDVVEQTDSVVLFPREGSFVVEWERVGEVEATQPRTAPRPDIESVVSMAHGSTVSTLEGKRITRLLYKLKFAGTKPIAFELPDGIAVERAFLNGVAIAVDLTDSILELDMAPARAGDEEGTLELVLSSSAGNYHLSGTIGMTLPKVSWPINQLYLDLHLPQVFNYSWSGGSLSPIDTAPKANYSYDVPLPGKKLSFHQYLISSSRPTINLEYAVDLEGHYYRP